jgi:PDZ domain/Aspartyl protease
MRPLHCALTLLLAWPLAARTETPTKPVTVPFELLRSGHMAVQAKINGKGPYRLIFDTGAPVTLLNNKVAREAGLLKGAAKPAFAIFGTMGDVKVRSLQVGGLEARDTSAIVMDHPVVELMAKKLGPLEGIVGFPFFARYKVTLDYKARTLTFAPSTYRPGDPLKTLEAEVMKMVMGGPTPPKVLAAAGQWGLRAEKGAKDEEAGVTVREVLAGGAAAAAGVKAGDRLLSIDGRWTDSLPDLYAAAAHVKPGAAAVVRVKRGGKEIELKVKPLAGL